MKSILNQNIKLGSLELKNRVIMAPLTRMRSNNQNEPTALNETYYSQRASAGLIITEATQISQQGQGYPNTPGIYSKKQIAAWKKICDSVHKNGGKIILQLWHVGRVSHSSYQPQENLPVAPSPILPTGQVLLQDFSPADYEIPHELTPEEINVILNDYATAAKNAKEAGFDGVEVHGANGYLIEQFLRSISNHRTDQYGGSFSNRSRFLFEVLDRVIEVWGSDKVGLRLSPFSAVNTDLDPLAKHHLEYLLPKLSEFNLAYLHIARPHESIEGILDLEEGIDWSTKLIDFCRSLYDGSLIAAGGFDKESAEMAIEENVADAIAFGRNFISNPDLPERLFMGAELNAYDRSTFYGGNEVGYTDYPRLLNTEAV